MVESEEHDAARVGPGGGRERWSLVAARRARRRPEVEDDRVAAQLVERELAVGKRRRERSRPQARLLPDHGQREARRLGPLAVGDGGGEL